MYIAAEVNAVPIVAIRYLPQANKSHIVVAIRSLAFINNYHKVGADNLDFN
jgi:hypothetical protein